MARQINRLSARSVAAAKVPGYYGDGGGLYLQVSPTGTKSWLYRFMLSGCAREMGLGSILSVTLAQAREKAGECRNLRATGIDPIEAKRTDLARLALAAGQSLTFQQCADAYIEAHRSSWKNAKHVDQWINTIKTYCGSAIGALPVSVIDTPDILKALRPIWIKKQETASRLRGRIEKILDWATVSKHRSGDNPARWRGHLDKLLAKIEKRKRIKHHPSMPYEQIGAFMLDLQKQSGTAARGLEFLILTAGRTGEVIGALPDEFELAKLLWTVPGERMKAGKVHRVPLSSRAVQIIKGQPDGGYVFPGRRDNSPLSNMAMLQLLGRLGHSALTVHGFRSTFRDWAGECTNYPREVCEMALAHTIGNDVEAAYLRGDLFEKRRRLMNDWAKFCSSPMKSGKVTPIRRKA